MRYIKYKVWDTEKKKWLDHNELLDNVKVSSSVRDKECTVYYKDSEICMFTGFYDSYDKPIYEGHIVKLQYSWDKSREKTFNKIVWLDSCACFAMIQAGDTKPYTLYEQLDGNEVEIIGNIYEDSNLLNKSSSKDNGKI